MKLHRFDPISFFSGLVIAAVGLLFLIPGSTADLVDAIAKYAVWFWPVLLVIVGLVILLSAIGRGRDGDPTASRNQEA